jgi:hypothetical protein
MGLDAEVADGAFQLAVSEEKLAGAQAAWSSNWPGLSWR